MTRSVSCVNHLNVLDIKIWEVKYSVPVGASCVRDERGRGEVGWLGVCILEGSGCSFLPTPWLLWGRIQTWSLRFSGGLVVSKPPWASCLWCLQCWETEPSSWHGCWVCLMAAQQALNHEPSLQCSAWLLISSDALHTLPAYLCMQYLEPRILVPFVLILCVLHFSVSLLVTQNRRDAECGGACLSCRH